jgi:rare lipoprotein A
LKPFHSAAGATVLALGLAAAGIAPVSSAEAGERKQRQEEQRQQRGQDQRQSQGRRSQEGQASYYGRQFNGRPMANGERCNPNSNSAAHRTLPLGSTAQVTNLQNGRSATVKVEDRGPYSRGRVIDVSPRTADEIGMKNTGHAPVRVTPTDVPERDEGRQAQR